MIENHTAQIGARITGWAPTVAWQSMFPIDRSLPCCPERPFLVSFPPQGPKHICSPLSLQISSPQRKLSELPSNNYRPTYFHPTSCSSLSYYFILFSLLFLLLPLIFCFLRGLLQWCFPSSVSSLVSSPLSLSLPCVCIYMAQSHLRITKLKYPDLSTIVSSSPNLSISSPLSS